MFEFQELMKSVTKSWEYMRNFYVYGFKYQGDFDRKVPKPMK